MLSRELIPLGDALIKNLPFAVSGPFAIVLSSSKREIQTPSKRSFHQGKSLPCTKPRYRQALPIYCIIQRRFLTDSTQQLLGNIVFAADIGQAHVAAFEEKRQFLVIQAKQFQNRRVQIVDVDAVLHRAKTKFVG